MLLRYAATCLLILAATVSPAFGQTRGGARSTFSIAGNVRDDSDQHPMENVRVDLKQSTGVPVNTTFTRGNGEFEFGNLSNGEYTIEIDVKDYESFRQQVSIFNSSRRGVSIFLARPLTIRTETSTRSISAHELSVPGKAHGEYEKGLQLLYRKGDFRGAISQFERAIKLFPTFYEAYAQEGSAYLQLGDATSAEAAMRKSVDLSAGQFSEGSFMLAGLLTDSKRYAEAEAIAQKGIASDPSSWHGPFELARAQAGLKKFEEAEKTATVARDMKPDNPPVYLMLANIHVERRNYNALLKDLDQFLKLVPNGPQSEQARKNRDELKAAMENAEKQEQSRAQANASQESAKSQTANTLPPTPRKDEPPAMEPDSSGLTSLPPPSPENQ